MGENHPNKFNCHSSPITILGPPWLDINKTLKLYNNSKLTKLCGEIPVPLDSE